MPAFWIRLSAMRRVSSTRIFSSFLSRVSACMISGMTLIPSLRHSNAAALKRAKPVERPLPRLAAVGNDHLLNRKLPVRAAFGVLKILEEHMFGAAEPDSRRAHFASLARILRRIGIGANSQFANFVSPLEDRVVMLGHFWRSERHLACINRAVTAIQCVQMPLMNNAAVRRHLLGRKV